MQLTFNVRVGLMRVVRKLLESIEVRLTTEGPSRELLCKYMTEEHAKSVLMFCANSDPAEAVHLLPDAFTLVSLTTMLRQLNFGSTQKKGKIPAKTGVTVSVIDDLDAIIRDLFCPTWTAVGQECGRTALSESIVALFCKSNQQVSKSSS